VNFKTNDSDGKPVMIRQNMFIMLIKIMWKTR